MSDKEQDTLVPRVSELMEATNLEGEKLRDFLVDAVEKQFAKSSDDPLEIMMGGLTIGAMVQMIANDMVSVGASQKIIDAINEAKDACDRVSKVCEEDRKAREEKKKQEA